MKKVINFLALIVAILIFLSCSNKENPIDEQNLNELTNFISKKVTNSEIINGFLAKVSTLKSTGGISYNTNDIYEMELSGSSQKFYFIHQIGFDEFNDSNYGLFNAIDDNGNFGKPLIVNTQKRGEDKIISYYDDSNNLIISLTLDSDNQKIEIISLKSANGLGQDTMDCIIDAYSNHGWFSVGAWVATLIIPETGVLIAADCALHQIMGV